MRVFRWPTQVYVMLELSQRGQSTGVHSLIIVHGAAIGHHPIQPNVTFLLKTVPETRLLRTLKDTAYLTSFNPASLVQKKLGYWDFTSST